MRIRKALGVLLTLLVVSVTPLAAACEVACEPAMVRDCCAGMPGEVVVHNSGSRLSEVAGHCESGARGVKSGALEARSAVSPPVGLMGAEDKDCGAGLRLNAAVFQSSSEALRGELLAIVGGTVPVVGGSRTPAILHSDAGSPWLSRIEPFRSSFRV